MTHLVVDWTQGWDVIWAQCQGQVQVAARFAGSAAHVEWQGRAAAAATVAAAAAAAVAMAEVASASAVVAAAMAVAASAAPAVDVTIALAEVKPSAHWQTLVLRAVARSACLPTVVSAALVMKPLLVVSHMRYAHMVVCHTLEFRETHGNGHYNVADAIYVLLTHTPVSYTEAMMGEGPS